MAQLNFELLVEDEGEGACTKAMLACSDAHPRIVMQFGTLDQPKPSCVQYYFSLKGARALHAALGALLEAQGSRQFAIPKPRPVGKPGR